MNTDALRGLERLTKRRFQGVEPTEVQWAETPCANCKLNGAGCCTEKCWYGRIIHRLALYESLVPALLAERDSLCEWKSVAHEAICEILRKVSHTTGRVQISQDLYFTLKMLRGATATAASVSDSQPTP